jgi:type III secretory pathway component EscS
VGSVVGLVMVFGSPPLSGIDEPYHFLRSWSISDGDLIPDRGDLPDFGVGGGECLPTRVTSELFELRRPYLERLIPDFDGEDPLKVIDFCPEDQDKGANAAGSHFVDLATFAWYTPMSYAPQAAAVGLGRLLGTSVATQLLLARLATLTATLALSVWAVALAPRAKWALAAVALLPVSLFQAATSISPDGITLAAVLLVVATALRAADPELGLSTRRVLLEAVGSAGLLAVAKPTYIVAVGVYLAAVLVHRSLWPVLVVGAGAVGISVGWHAWLRPLFICDVRYFGVPTDPDTQITNLTRAPWRLGTAAVRGVVDHGARWVRDTILIGDRVVAWGLVVCVIALLGFAAVALIPTPGPSLGVWQRVVFVAIGAVMGLAVTAGWLISCSRPELRIDNPPHARLLVPCVVPILVGLSPPWRARWAPPGTVVLVGLSGFYAVWLTYMITTMW